MAKYKNIKTTLYGITFDSKAEAKRYLALREMKKHNLIADLELQPKFVLQEGFNKNGKRYREITYIADFRYFDKVLNIPVIEDVKGVKTKEFMLKYKLFEHKYPQYSLTIV